MSLTVDIKKKIGNFTLDVSFTAKEGVTGLLGASGSGKSVTLMCVAGIVKPDSGSIILNGVTLFDSQRRINLSPQQRRVGYLFQSYALFPNMTVRQNILCGLIGEKDKAKKLRALEEILHMMRLEDFEGRRPDELSGGQRQRVALARILVGSPDMLVLDEPFSALDSYLRGQVIAETRNLLQRFGREAILVTHSRSEAYQLCGEIALVDKGRIIVHKNVKQLFTDPESRQAAILTGCKNIVGAGKAGEKLVHVPDWGVSFETSGIVRDDTCAIGIRAHYFNPRSPQNRFPIEVTGELEQPFEYVIQFRFKDQLPGTEDIWWRIPKEKRPGKFPPELGISPVNIMPLYS